jgi:hypothetical protein
MMNFPGKIICGTLFSEKGKKNKVWYSGGQTKEAWGCLRASLHTLQAKGIVEVAVVGKVVGDGEIDDDAREARR